MKIGELLRQLADAIDAEGLTTANDLDPDPIMVTPLQQEHELLKKSTGVENDVAVFAADDPNELARLQQMAGIPQQAPVLNQTIVINTGQPNQEATVQTTTPEPVAETIIEPVKPIKKMSYKDTYATVSENDDCIIDVGNAYNRLQQEFNTINGNKGTK